MISSQCFWFKSRYFLEWVVKLYWSESKILRTKPGKYTSFYNCFSLENILVSGFHIYLKICHHDMILNMELGQSQVTCKAFFWLTLWNMKLCHLFYNCHTLHKVLFGPGNGERCHLNFREKKRSLLSYFFMCYWN